MGTKSKSYNIILANYFAYKSLYLDEPTQKKPNTRKLVEQPWQQTKGKLWDEVTETLCNLDFIQAKAAAKMTYELVNDFNTALEVIPDNKEAILEEKTRQARMDKYTQDLIACAKGEITINELDIPESIRPWTKEQTVREIERIRVNPNLADRLKDFLHFLENRAPVLQKFSFESKHFVYQEALNFTDDGALGHAVEKKSSENYKGLLLRSKNTRPKWNPLPQLLKVLFVLNDLNYNSSSCVSITPDGRFAFTISDNGNCVLWNLRTGKVIHALKDHRGRVTSVAITPDAKFGISGSRDKTCIFWDLISGKKLLFHDKHSKGVNSVSITPDGGTAISVSQDNLCVIWDLKTGETKPLTEHNASVHSVYITPDGKKAISGSSDKTCILWDLTTGKVLQKLEGNSLFLSVAMTPDSRKAICGGNICLLWDLVTGEKVQILKEVGLISSVSITSDGCWALVGADINCTLYNLQTGESHSILYGHKDQINSIAMTPDGQMAISGSKDYTSILWNLGKGVTLEKSRTHFRKLDALSISHDGKQAIFGADSIHVGGGPICRTWDIANAKNNLTLRGHTGHTQIGAVAYTPDSKRAVSGAFTPGGYGGSDCLIILWDLVEERVSKKLLGHTRSITAISISPDGTNAISSSRDSTCIIWNLITGELIHTLEGHGQYNIGTLYKPDHNPYVDSITYLPDGKDAIFHTSGLGCKMWDAIAGNSLNKVLPQRIGKSHITSDGRKVFSISGDGKKGVYWELKTGQIIQLIKGHTGFITCISVSPDGKRAISGSSDGSCILWDLETGTKLSTYIEISAVRTVAFLLGSILIGTQLGEIIILNSERDLLCPHIANTTIKQIWDFELNRFSDPLVYCPLCGHRFEPPKTLIKTIIELLHENNIQPDQSPCLELPDESWEHPGLLGECPQCHEGIKFNPFFGSDAERISDWFNAKGLDLKYRKLVDDAEKAFKVSILDKISKENLTIKKAEPFDATYLKNKIATSLKKSEAVNNILDKGSIPSKVSLTKRVTDNTNEEPPSVGYQKILGEADSDFNIGNWENAAKLYLKLIQAQKFDVNYLRFRMALCRINSLEVYNPEIIANIKVLKRLLLEAGENERVQQINDKLSERLEAIKEAKKPWWKKLFENKTIA